MYCGNSFRTGIIPLMTQNQFRWITVDLPDVLMSKLILITGARQVGKTTVSRSVYNKLPYFNLDSTQIRDQLTQVRASLWGQTVGICILDEVQKCPQLFEKIKYAYDERSIQSSVLLGSSQVLLLKHTSESLAGRVFIYELFPLMLSEYGLKENNAPQRTPLCDSVVACQKLSSVLGLLPSVELGKSWDIKQAQLAACLRWGCMPELLSLSDANKSRWHYSYEKTFLERDLADLARLSDLGPFKKIQKLAALRTSQVLNLSDFSADAGVSIDTCKRYLEYLKISYQAFTVPPYHTNVTSTVRKAPKLHFMDVGIARQLTLYGGAVTGELFETYVVSELYKWIKTRQLAVSLYYYRTRSGAEIDLLIETEMGVLGIEIKSKRHVEKKDARGLLDFAKQVQKPWVGGLVVYSGDSLSCIDVEHDIWAMPVAMLLT